MIKKLTVFVLSICFIFANEESFTTAEYQNGLFYKSGYDENGYFIKKYSFDKEIYYKKPLSLKDSDLFIYDTIIDNNKLYLSGGYKEKGIIIQSDKDLNEKFFIPQISNKRDFFYSLETDKTQIFAAGGAIKDIDLFPYLTVLSKDGTIESEKYFPNLQNGWFTKIAKTKNFLYLGGIKQNEKTKNDIFILKTDLNGNEIQRRALATKKDDFIKDIKTDKEGNIYILCESFGDLEGIKNRGFSDLSIIKLDENLQTVWKKSFATPYADTPVNLQIKDNYIYIGVLNSVYFDYSLAYNDKNSFIIKIDKNGYKIWSQPFDIKNLLKIKIENNDLILMGEEDKIVNLKNLNKDAFIKRIYSRLFDRTPKEHEIKYWENFINSKKSLRKALIYFYNSPEFSQKRENLTKIAFIKLSYNALLNREVDKKGLAYWQNFEKEEIWKKVIYSSEFNKKTHSIF